MKRFMFRFGCGAAFVLFVCAGAFAEEQKRVLIPPEFEKSFRHGLEYIRELAQYSAQGKLLVHAEAGEKKEELQYSLSMARKEPDFLSVTVTKAADRKIVGRLLFIGSKGRTNVYLPRQTSLTPAPSTVGEFPDTLTLAIVMTLYEYLEYSKPDRWLSRIGEVEDFGNAKFGDVERNHLKFALSYYFTLRNLGMELWLDQGDKPLLKGLKIDLSKALEDRRLGTMLGEGTRVSMALELSNWILATESATDEFEAPGTPTEYEIIDVSDILMANNGAMISHASPSFSGLGDNAQLLQRLIVRQQMPTASERAQIISRLKDASPAERAQLMDRIRSTMSKSSVARPKTQGISQHVPHDAQDAERLRARIGR